MRITSSLFVMALLGSVATAAAQTEITVVGKAPLIDSLSSCCVVVIAGAMPNDVVNRIRSFDVNRDNQITPDELPDRMHHLIRLADHNGDGVLTWNEVTRQVDAAFITQRASPSGSPTAAKATTLADVVSDLRLEQPRHDLVMALVNNYKVPRNVNINLSEVDLLNGLRELLHQEEYENFLAAAARIRNGPQFR